MSQHELLTDGPPPEAPEPAGLMDLRYRNERFQVDVPDVNYELNKTELTRRVIALAAQFDKLANAVQGLPNRDDHDAIVGDVDALQRQVGGIYTELKVIRQSQLALTKSIEAILLILPTVRAA